MLREVKSAAFGRRLTALGWRWFLVEGGRAGSVTWRRRALRRLHAAQEDAPVPLFARAERTYWLFEGRVYWEDGGLTSADVTALVRERQRRDARRLERAHAALAADADDAEAPRRRPIPRAVRLAVFERDGGRCVECGSAFDLQYDHVIPLALGGAGTAGNLQLLCAACNRAKGAGLG